MLHETHSLCGTWGAVGIINLKGLGDAWMGMVVHKIRRARRVVTGLVQLHPPVGIVVAASAVTCLQTLITASQPSQNRLHLRDVFAEGRRYAVQPRTNGFSLTTATMTRRNGRRRRSRIAATVTGTFTGDAEMTFVRLHYHASPLYGLYGLAVPAFFASIVLYVEWSVMIRALLIALLFGLAFINSRLDAALQVGDMVFFVRKALDDLPPVDVPQLAPAVPGVVMRSHRDFWDEWEKFYQERVREEERG